MTRIVQSRAELRAALDGRAKVAFVPTMGALHAGHVSLLETARPLGDALVASIFVNPTQFGEGEDFEDYPRTLEADLAQCEAAGVDIVFCPTVETVYPTGLGDITVQPGRLGSILEGAARPTHFAGVLTVVAKLFGLVRPAVAVFGEKDYQQLVLIRQMAAELCLDVEVLGSPTAREGDGLAMSSRNVYLTPEDRARAAALPQALRAAVEASPRGAEAVLESAQRVLAEAGIDPDYLVLADRDLGPATPGDEARLLVAARIGRPRLIDNTALHLGTGS